MPNPSKQDLLADVPPDLWGLLEDGGFSSAGQANEAYAWVQRVLEAYGDAHGLAEDLGWNEAWRREVWRQVYGPHEDRTPAIVFALYKDLGGTGADF